MIARREEGNGMAMMDFSDGSVGNSPEVMAYSGDNLPAGRAK